MVTLTAQDIASFVNGQYLDPQSVSAMIRQSSIYQGNVNVSVAGTHPWPVVLATS